MSGIMAWACWAIPLLITEVLLQAGKIKKPTVVTRSAANTVLAKERLTVVTSSDIANEASK